MSEKRVAEAYRESGCCFYETFRGLESAGVYVRSSVSICGSFCTIVGARIRDILSFVYYIDRQDSQAAQHDHEVFITADKWQKSPCSNHL